MCVSGLVGVGSVPFVEGRSVRLERDVSDHDRYGRLLRFVYLEDGTLVNEMLTALSWALLIGSFVTTHQVWPQLTPWRAAVQLIGLAYNYRIVPTPAGLSRLK